MKIIYEKDAIEALHKTMLEFFKTDCDDEPEFITASEKMLLSVNKAISNALKVLPSAQPDNECEKCVFAPFKQFRQEWIPVSERLPEEYGNYLISTYDGDVDVGTIDPKKKGVWSACDADGFYWLREVLAWMPLPEPYTERREDGENG